MTHDELRKVLRALEDLWKPLPTGKLPADGMCMKHMDEVRVAVALVRAELDREDAALADLARLRKSAVIKLPP